jgi:hypothetical protein
LYHQCIRDFGADVGWNHMGSDGGDEMSTAKHIRSFWNGHYWEVQTKREGESEFNYHSPTIASVWPVAPNFMDAEETANIFAAAPDLLEALKHCVNHLNQICERAFPYSSPEERKFTSVRNAEAAIAKAEGGAR